MEFFSTSMLASRLNIPASELFATFKSLQWIDRENDKWVLTNAGKLMGGQTRTSENTGVYIVWPENINLSPTKSGNLLNATSLGKHFNISSQRLNLILSELGWIEKTIAGWTITKFGKSFGGIQKEHETSGSSYVLWTEKILTNTNLVSVFNTTVTEIDINHTISIPISASSTELDFRKKYEAKYRTLDGHYVRSKSEALIDNLLYQSGIVHAYERKIQIDNEEVLSDFYLPTGKVYIEFWGLENDPKYLNRKKKKIEFYKHNDLALIELDENDIMNLDDHLPKKLLKYGIKVY